MDDKEDDVDSKLHGPAVFGRRLGDIPCFRNSFLYGFSGGIATGLLYFMYSSKPRISSHVGMTGFVVTTMTYWVFCRHNWERQLKEADKLKEFMREYNRLEGTREQLNKEMVTVSSV